MKRTSTKRPPLSPATLHILLALANEELHGYGIIQKVFRQSQEHYKLGPGTLYDNLKKLMQQDMVADVPRTSGSAAEEKRLYRLTAEGRVALSTELDRLRTVLREAALLTGDRKPRTA